MEERYSRNYLYISEEQQRVIKDIPILVGGCGIGSVIAECVLRMGFENLTLVDGDIVEISNLNRQNYTLSDIGNPKAECLYNRLMQINGNAKIKYYNEFLNENNLEKIISGHKIAINALDFDTPAPLKFDEICSSYNIPVIHPFNLGWAGLVTVIDPNGQSLSSIQKKGHQFDELAIVNFAIRNIGLNNNISWFKSIAENFSKNRTGASPPQLAAGSSIISGMAADTVFQLSTALKDEIAHFFPNFIFLSIR